MVAGVEGGRVADFSYERDELTVVVLRVPRILWDRWEYRHKHYGKAIHALRQHCIEVMAIKGLRSSEEWVDRGDPFFRE